MRVAIVHDWCVTYGGAERVLERIIDMFPDADVFSLIDKVPPAQRGFLRGKTPKVSFFQKIPSVEKHYRKLLALMPHAIEQFDLHEYDLIISSHYSVAKGVITGPRQVHVCYCHSPMRYAWDMQHASLRDAHLDRGLKSVIARMQLHRLRQWDARCANNVDQFVANSKFVSDRIWRCYRRDSIVIPPPVDVAAFVPVSPKSDHYISVGRLVPYKKVDLLVEAFRRTPDLRLVVVGDGPQLETLRRTAPKNVELLGRLEFDKVKVLVATARALLFPAYEDFGIVPVEAQAAGTPVIAFGSGGSLETVVDCEASEAGQQGGAQRQGTGIFFKSQTVDAVLEAVDKFEKLGPGAISVASCREQALRFSAETFDAAFKQAVEQAVKAGNSSRRMLA